MCQAINSKPTYDFPNSNSKQKGQWFLVSAVMATGVFLVISMLFRSYSVIDTSETARANEDFYFHGIKQEFNSVVASSDCTNMDTNLQEYRAFAEREINNLGYRFFLNYTINNCATQSVTMGLLIASSRFMVYEGVDPAGLGLA